MSTRWMPQSLDDVPDRLILFDGVCVLCCWWVRFVIERDASARFRFVAIQSIRGSALATRLAVDVASPETNVAIINGHAYFKIRRHDPRSCRPARLVLVANILVAAAACPRLGL